MSTEELVEPSTPSAGAHAPAGELVTCRPAMTDTDRTAHHAIRHQVFVLEQQVFTESEHDDYDIADDVIHLLGRYGDTPAGAVRLFPLDPETGLWQGDRLCVLPPYRVHGIGSPLVRCAVATAGAHGGQQMVAHIQLPNVRFFAHLGWEKHGDTELYAGIEHQPMAIDLPTQRVGAELVEAFAVGVRH